jgi:hypothetical protein
MKIRIALLSGFLALVASAAAAIPTATIPSDQTTAPIDLLETSPAPSAFQLPEPHPEGPLQISQQAPWPCDDDPIGPFFILGPMGPTTGPFDPTKCLPFPWPLPF